jgi:hypothetical protein
MLSPSAWPTIFQAMFGHPNQKLGLLFRLKTKATFLDKDIIICMLAFPKNTGNLTKRLQ